MIPTSSQTPLNPYITGRAVTGREFFGRDDVFKSVQSQLSLAQQNAVVLYGQRRIGKTSVLLELYENLPKDQFAPIYFDLFDKGNFSLAQVLESLTEAIAAEFNLTTPAPEAPADFERDLLPRLYATLGTRRPVVLLDEFDVLDYVEEDQRSQTGAAANEFFPYLRRLIENESRLAFVVALGRKAEDLSTHAISVFKSAARYPISVLSPTEARELIDLSERIGGPHFEPGAAGRILALTSGHPYFTQLFCQILYTRATTDNVAVKPVTSQMVDATITEVLQTGDHIFEWIWRGLTPAERINFSALAALLRSETAAATHNQIAELLEQNRLRIGGSELAVAPDRLVKGELLKQEPDGSYKFFVELLRRWVIISKPLAQTSREISQIEPRAELEYRGAIAAYRDKDIENAIHGFRESLRLNDAHLEARLALAQALLEKEDFDGAVREYDIANRQSPELARGGLIIALLRRAAANEARGAWEAVLADAERVLLISKNEGDAVGLKTAALVKLGDEALERNYFADAERFYALAGVGPQKAVAIQTRRHERDLERREKNYQESLQRLTFRAVVAILLVCVTGGVAGLWAADGVERIAAIVNPSPTPSATDTPTVTPTGTPPPSPTASPTVTATFTLTPSATPTPRPSVAAIIDQPAAYALAAAFSPDGSLLASGYSDGTTKLWSVLDNSEIAPLVEHANWVRAVAFSPDGSLLATGSGDTTIKVWDTNTKRALRTLADHQGDVYAVAFSPDGLLASGSSDTTVKLWNISTGSVLRTFDEHTGAVYSLAFSPDGRYLAAGSADRTIRVWDLTDGQNRILSGQGNSINALAFSPDGRWLISGSADHSIRVWQVATGTVVDSIINTGGPVRAVAFSSDGSLLAIATSNAVRLYETRRWTERQALFASAHVVAGVAFSPDNLLLASASEDGRVYLWNLEGYELYTPTPTSTSTATLTVTASATPTLFATATITPTFPLPPTFTPRPS